MKKSIEITKEQIAVMQAYIDGKKIEYKNVLWEHWVSCENPTWDWNTYEYRIVEGTRLRPYKDAQEFIEAMNEHGPMIGYKHKKAFMGVELVNDHGIMLKYEILMRLYNEVINFIWQDGTPCGVME